MSTRDRVLRVTVLHGGPSAERAVSIESGKAIAAALRRRGHTVTLADISPEQLDILDQPTDVIFPALHGTFGEDGTVQRLMEHRGLCYVGSDARASALAIDKVLTKERVHSAGIPTPLYEVWDAAQLARGGGSKIQLPRVCKPIDQGSSVLTQIARDEATCDAAVKAIVDAYGRALVEQFVAGDELTVGLLGRTPLPPICIRPKANFYDYKAKYEANDTEYLFDTGLPADVLEEVQALSVKVFDLVGCRHLSRVDWIVDANRRPWFLEINTLPGFTSHSLVPKAAAKVGIPFDELVEKLVFMALEGHG